MLRLPPYHSDLNPIELIWAYQKKHVATKNNAFNLTKAEALFKEAREMAEMNGLWERCVEHTTKLEDEYWTNDGIMDELDSLVVDVTDVDDIDDVDDDVDGDDGGDGAMCYENMESDYVEEDDDDANTVCEGCKLRDPSECDESVIEWIECSLCDCWFHKCCMDSNSDSTCKRCYQILTKSF